MTHRPCSSWASPAHTAVPTWPAVPQAASPTFHARTPGSVPLSHHMLQPEQLLTTISRKCQTVPSAEVVIVKRNPPELCGHQRP